MKGKLVIGFRGVLLASMLLYVANCSRQPKRVPAPTEIAKVKVAADARVYFNERAVSMDDLNREFARLKEIHGAVWFFDESSSEISREQARLVKKSMINAGLPIRLR